jgi:hypothetical protein
MFERQSNTCQSQRGMNEVRFSEKLKRLVFLENLERDERWGRTRL